MSLSWEATHICVIYLNYSNFTQITKNEKKRSKNPFFPLKMGSGFKPECFRTWFSVFQDHEAEEQNSFSLSCLRARNMLEIRKDRDVKDKQEVFNLVS